MTLTNFPNGISSMGVPLVGSLAGNTWFVNGWDGNDFNDGKSFESPFLTMAQAFSVIGSNDVVYLTGRITENLVAPLGVFDVTKIGRASCRERV